MHIGVFDSGVGGFSVLESIQKHLHHTEAKYFYCCDQAHFPYGIKEESEVVRVATDACVRFVNAAKLDVLVIACGTASTVVLPAVRAQVSCPVVGVVPAVKPAASLSKSKHIAVLSTKATASRPYLKQLISDFASDCKVTVLGSANLVSWAEQKIRGETLDLAGLKEELVSLFQDAAHPVDVVVLGCTHFPLLIPELSSVVPWPVTWMDSGEAVARRVEQLLAGLAEEKHLGVLGQKSADGLLGFGYTTGDVETLWGKTVPAWVQGLGLKEWKRLL